jgi:hypothetical protein
LALTIQFGSLQCRPTIDGVQSLFETLDGIEILQRFDSSFEFHPITGTFAQIAQDFCARRVSSIKLDGYNSRSERGMAVATEPEFCGRRSRLWLVAVDVRGTYNPDWAASLLGVAGLAFASLAVDDSVDLDDYDANPAHFPANDFRLVEAYVATPRDPGLSPWQRATGPAFHRVSSVKKLR